MFEKKPKMITVTNKRAYSGKVGYQGLNVEGSKTEEFTPMDGVLFDIPEGKSFPYLDQYGRYVLIRCDKETRTCTVEKVLDDNPLKR